MAQEWHKVAGEGELAHRHFEDWLFRPSPRPNVSTYEKVLRQDQAAGALPKISKPASRRQLYRWYEQFNWVTRAAAYDRYMLESEVTARQAARTDAATDSELESYRERLRRGASVLMNIGTAMGGLAIREIKRISESDEKPGGGVAALGRAAGALIQNSLDIEAAVLGVDDIIGTLGRSASVDYSGDE